MCNMKVETALDERLIFILIFAVFTIRCCRKLAGLGMGHEPLKFSSDGKVLTRNGPAGESGKPNDVHHVTAFPCGLLFGCRIWCIPIHFFYAYKNMCIHIAVRTRRIYIYIYIHSLE